MKPKAVVWDIDDVLAATSDAFYQTVLDTHGDCSHPDHWSDYLWGKHIDRPEGRETQQYLIEHRIIEIAKPYDYTSQALQLINQAGMENVLLSARAWHPSPTETTWQWSREHSLDAVISDMYFVEVEEPKSHRLKELCDMYDVQGFVDDNPFHAHSAIGIVPEIYLVHRRWNADHEARPHFTCVDSSLEAAQLIVNSLKVN